MFRGYFDEADNGKIYVIAGWIASADEWDRFSVAWNAALSSPPLLTYFSHHEAKSQKGQFVGWDQSSIDAKFDQLVQVICDHDLYGVVTGLNLKTWQSAFQSDVLSQKQVKSVLRFTHPYQSCFHSAVGGALQRQLERGFHGSLVDFIFDEQRGLLKEAIKHYELFRQNFPKDTKEIAGQITPGDDKIVLPLQAADLLAGQVITSMTFGSAERWFQTLGDCHEIAQFKAYPSNFEVTSDLVKTLERIWPEKALVDQQLKAERANQPGQSRPDGNDR